MVYNSIISSYYLLCLNIYVKYFLKNYFKLLIILNYFKIYVTFIIYIIIF